MTTPILGLTELVDGQASQGATANQMFRELEGKLVRIVSRTLTAQPSVVDGEAYLIPSGATGAGWSVNTGKIVIAFGGIFNYFTPVEGWRVWVNNEDLLIAYNGTSWDVLSGLLRMPAITIINTDSPYAVTAAHRGRIILCDTSSGSIELDFAAAATLGNGFVVAVKKTSGSNTLTLDPNSTENIDGSSTSPALTAANDSRIIVSSGTALWTVGGGGVTTFDALTDTPANKTGASLQFVRVNAGETALEYATPAGAGDVVGPGGSPATTDNAVTRWNGTTGTSIQDSGVLVDDNNRMSGHGTLINAQTGTTYTLVGTDNGKTVTLTNGAAITLTIPEQGTEVLPAGFQCAIIQRGAGQVTVAVEGTDTIESKDSNVKLTGQHSAATIVLLVAGAPNTFGLYGDLSA